MCNRRDYPVKCVVRTSDGFVPCGEAVYEAVAAVLCTRGVLAAREHNTRLGAKRRTARNGAARIMADDSIVGASGGIVTSSQARFPSWKHWLGETLWVELPCGY